MPPLTLAAIAFAFVAVGLVAGTAMAAALRRFVPAQRRLQELAVAGHAAPPVPVVSDVRLEDRSDPRLERVVRMFPKSPKEMMRVRSRLARAGYYSLGAAIVYSASELVLPVVFGLAVYFLLSRPLNIMLGVLAAMVGYMLPSLVLGRQIARRTRQIENGLPDALDLLIVCIEAGSSVDQALARASDELGIAYPALAYEFQVINTEVRAGKRRLEAFKNFAERTRSDDVRALVAMLVQTDRFGTSVGQALRTYAGALRTRRRQRAEERAAKLGVKLVFPLVFFLFPALYVVLLGPAAIKIFRVLIQEIANR